MAAKNKAVVTAIIANLAIAAAKLTAFLFTGPSAMLAETIHSLVDTGNGSLLVLGERMSAKPADASHPFGYGKELYFWTLLVALFIFLIGGGASIFEGINRVRNPHPVEHVLWSYVTITLAAVFEGYALWVSIGEFREAEGVRPSWRAIHDSKDPTTFTVIFEDVAALFGLLTALVGTLLGQTMQWPLADGIASIVIGSTLMLVAFLLIVESKALLVGEGASPQMLNAIHTITEKQEGVRRAGYPMTMYFGPRNVLLTMNVRFDQTLTRDRIEQSVDAIEAAIRSRFPDIRHIYLEAESIGASQRLNDPAYPGPGDLPPSPAETASIRNRGGTLR